MNLQKSIGGVMVSMLTSSGLPGYGQNKDYQIGISTSLLTMQH
jgi:hypothetical protein